MKKIIFICFPILVLSNVAFATEKSADQRFLYIGGSIGITDPVVKKFQHKDSGTDLRLNKSTAYIGRVGYSFYPQIALEFSASHQPKYKLNYTLPKQDLLPQIHGSTRVLSDIYALNIVYEFVNLKSVSPFFMLGAGVARVVVEPSITKLNILNMDVFRINKTKTNCFAWQAGIGVSAEVTNNFSIDLISRLQVAHSIKIKYDTLDKTTGKFIAATPIKKTIGVAEFGIGFRYKLPI